MRWIREFDLFLLDLDGLLVDTERLHYRAYQLLCARHRVALPWSFDQYLSVAHLSCDGLEKALLPRLGGGAWDGYYAQKKALYVDLLSTEEIAWMPGVCAFLQQLSSRQAKRCVVTHSAREQVEVIKERLPLLKTIPLWLTREDYAVPKPAPDGYLQAIEKLADPGDRIIGFEDSLRGICALRSTPALPILVCDPSHPQMQLSAAKQLTHFASFDHIALPLG